MNDELGLRYMVEHVEPDIRVEAPSCLTVLAILHIWHGRYHLPREADHHREVDHHGTNYIGTGIELKESPEWTESKEHTPKTLE